MTLMSNILVSRTVTYIVYDCTSRFDVLEKFEYKIPWLKRDISCENRFLFLGSWLPVSQPLTESNIQGPDSEDY